MTSASPERVGEGLYELAEAPVWSARDRALWHVDLRGRAVHRIDATRGGAARFAFDELVAGIVPRRSGGFAVALASRIVAFDPAADAARAAPATLFVPEPAALGNRLNETKSDRQGRLWTSSMRDFGAATTGSVYRIDAGGTCTRVLSPVTVPNGLVFSPDSRTLYFADTRDGRLRAYDFDAATGALGAMRVLVDDGVVPGRPDGAAVDADGCVWSARFGGGCVARITPAGNVDCVVLLPASQVTSCAFGDDDLRTLYVTTARQKLDAAALEREPLAGALFALRVSVPGLPEVELAL